MSAFMITETLFGLKRKIIIKGFVTDENKKN